MNKEEILIKERVRRGDLTGVTSAGDKKIVFYAIESNGVYTEYKCDVTKEER